MGTFLNWKLLYHLNSSVQHIHNMTAQNNQFVHFDEID